MIPAAFIGWGFVGVFVGIVAAVAVLMHYAARCSRKDDDL